MQFHCKRLLFTGTITSVLCTFILYIAMNEYSKENFKIRNIVDETVKRDKNYELDNDSSGSWLSSSSEEELIPKFLTDEEFMEIDFIMQERRQQLKEFCNMFKSFTFQDINLREFLINDRYKMIWCDVRQAATNTWFYNFNRMSGFSEEKAATFPNPLHIIRESYVTPSLEKLNSVQSNFTSAIIVRHPFERLIMAYVDKFILNCVGLYAALGRGIVNRYSKEGNETTRMTPTFKEFITFILDYDEKNVKMDPNWSPYTTFCTPCKFDFDVIIKFENIEREQKYLIDKAALGKLLNPQLLESDQIRKDGMDEMKVLYYSQLNTDILLQLFAVYRYDFILFDYTAEEYVILLEAQEEK